MLLKVRMAGQMQLPFRIKRRKIHSWHLNACVPFPVRQCYEMTSLFMSRLWPNSAFLLQCKSKIISWTLTEIICFILIVTESRFWPEFSSVSPAQQSSHWRWCHYGWGPECAKRIFSLAHISITSYVFDLLTLFLHLISARLVILTVIFYLFSNSAQLKKVTGMDRV